MTGRNRGPDTVRPGVDVGTSVVKAVLFETEADRRPGGAVRRARRVM